MFNVRFMATVAATTSMGLLGVAAPSAQASISPSPSAASVLKNTNRHAPGASATSATQRSARAESAVELSRLAGRDRYATAVAISQAHFPDGTWPADPDFPNEPPAPVDVVTIASGSNYPDALAGGPFAAGLGPLLLVPATGTIPAAVTAEIQRLAPQAIIILGGTGAVSSSVEAQLAKLGQTDRFAGRSRYDTAAQVAVATADDLGGAQTVVLSSGEGFADSLAGGASAANQGGVLLLTQRSRLPSETKGALQQIAPTRVQVLGGTGAVSDAVISSVKAALPGATVTRVAGPDRAATTAAISKVTFPTGAQETFLTNGWNYPDALAAAPLAWFWSSSVLLASTACAPAPTVAEDTRLAPTYRTAIGGTGAVSDAALSLKKC